MVVVKFGKSLDISTNSTKRREEINNSRTEIPVRDINSEIKTAIPLLILSLISKKLTKGSIKIAIIMAIIKGVVAPTSIYPTEPK